MYRTSMLFSIKFAFLENDLDIGFGLGNVPLQKRFHLSRQLQLLLGTYHLHNCDAIR